MTTHLTCRCGAVHLEVEGQPIMSVECCCASCREARARFEALPGATTMMGEPDTTSVVMVRKDRLRLTQGAGYLAEFRLKTSSPTRRVVATCCSTPLFMDFQRGHWLSVYAGLWPEDALPPVEMRTMASDLADPAVLPGGVPNLKTHSFNFYRKLLGAWVAMGLRVPKAPAARLMEI
jgi:hypothetical protein